MKNVLMAMMILGSSYAFAEGAAAPATPAQKPAAAEAKKAKLSHKAAKDDCLKENAGLKGKDLQKCIKDKRSM